MTHKAAYLLALRELYSRYQSRKLSFKNSSPLLNGLFLLAVLLGPQWSMAQTSSVKKGLTALNAIIPAASAPPKSSAPPPLVHKVYMFENSTRRDATLEELKPIVYFNSGCAGFFVKNKNNKPYIMTARHCYEFAFEHYCSNDQVLLYSFADSSKVKYGKCKTPIIHSYTDDAVIFEAEFEDDFKVPTESAYRLASKNPPACSKLQLVGFPGDSQRQRLPTVSENCWSQSEHSTPVQDVPQEAETQQKEQESLEEYWDAHPQMLQAMYQLSISQGLHNCSVYGGNSGGPLKIEGQQIAVGLPFQYLAVENVTHPASSGTVYEAFSGFVQKHKALIEHYGIETVENYPTALSFNCGLEI